MKVGFIAMCVVAISVVGCGSQRNWGKPGASFQDTESALSKCEYQMRLQRIPPTDRQRLMDLCMQGEGYRAGH